MSDIPQHKEVLDELEDVGELYHMGKVDELSELLKRASNKVKDFPQTSLKIHHWIYVLWEKNTEITIVQ